jgi:hypothetical protein
MIDILNNLSRLKVLTALTNVDLKQVKKVIQLIFNLSNIQLKS